MKGYWGYCAIILAAQLLSSTFNVATAAAASEPGDDDPGKQCEAYGLALARKIPLAKEDVRILPGHDIAVSKNYSIKVGYFDPKDRTQDDTGKIVAILTKGPEPIETAKIWLVCLNKHTHPSHCHKSGEIEFLSHLNKPLNIRFHLLREQVPGSEPLAQTSWSSTALESLGVSDGTADEDQTSEPPKPGQLPANGCLKAEDIKGGGNSDDLFFEFSKCLAPASDDIYYKYQLYFQRHNSNGKVTPYPLDPQIINHGH